MEPLTFGASGALSVVFFALETEPFVLETEPFWYLRCVKRRDLRSEMEPFGAPFDYGKERWQL